MLHFLVTARYDHTLRDYFGNWGARLHPVVSAAHYESAPWDGEPAAGTWVFTDLERLDEDTLARAAAFRERLASDPQRWRVLNDPSRVLCRYPLLNRLSAEGINTFRAFRLDEVPADARYPLFVRGEQDHEGSRSALLQDGQALRDFVAQNGAALEGIRPLAVEYLAYERADGLFAKYSMMRVGKTLVPRHILFGRQWQVKEPDVINASLAAEESAYIARGPHARDVMAVFELAGIDYGRIDYTLTGDRIQVFEINTNPMLVPKVAALHPRRWQGQADSALQLNRALRAAGARREAG